jgi:5,5'-dehydrodivanillate O-demethylase
VPVNGSSEIVRSMIYRVPVDDNETLLYFFRCYPDPKKSFITTKRETKLGEYDALEKDWWGINVNDQDRMAVEQQGVIADRTNEHLGVSDGGIILMRQMMREALAAIAEGRDPIGVIRDPAQQMVDFPQKSDMMRQSQNDDAVNYTAGFYKPAAE